MTLIGDLDCMDIFLCYAGVAHEETQLLIQSSLCEKVAAAQLEDRLLQVVGKCVEVGKPMSLVWMLMALFISDVTYVFHKKLS
jgi:hypothetical protein